MRCKAGVTILAFMAYPLAVQCELDEGHEGNHLAYRHFYPIEDVTDHSIKIFDSSLVDKLEVVWHNESNKTETVES
jgi:hypothetical protein